MVRRPANRRFVLERFAELFELTVQLGALLRDSSVGTW